MELYIGQMLQCTSEYAFSLLYTLYELMYIKSTTERGIVPAKFYYGSVHRFMFERVNTLLIFVNIFQMFSNDSFF